MGRPQLHYVYSDRQQKTVSKRGYVQYSLRYVRAFMCMYICMCVWMWVGVGGWMGGYVHALDWSVFQFGGLLRTCRRPHTLSGALSYSPFFSVSLSLLLTHTHTYVHSPTRLHIFYFYSTLPLFSLSKEWYEKASKVTSHLGQVRGFALPH